MGMETGKVLVCDHEEFVRQILNKAITGEGYNCTVTENITQAVASLETALPDVVVLEIVLLDNAGMTFLNDMKTRYPDIPVIVTSGDNRIDVTVQSIRNGAYDFVAKPFHKDEVLNCVKKAIQMHRLRLELHDYQSNLEEKVEEQAEELRQTFLGAMSALSFVLEAKDACTAGHSRRVADISASIGKEMRLSFGELEDLRWGSLMHDLAKLAVDERILRKPGKLTREEYRQVMSHPVIGACIAGPLVKRKRILDIIEHHHDRYDGTGMGQFLAGKDIPLLARIVAVADAYDAMTSDRSYRSALPREEALAQIKGGAGLQFDPQIVESFLRLSVKDIIPERKTILVADDDESIRLLVRSIIGNDYLVVEAADGQQAVDGTRSEKPLLVLMDILMPVMDGIQAISELKNDPETRNIPVIILTGIKEELRDSRLSEIHTSAFITKPFFPQDLLKTVQKVIEGLEKTKV